MLDILNPKKLHDLLLARKLEVQQIEKRLKKVEKKLVESENKILKLDA
tara:strand:+ start:1255 stop:1398 length:144 start_codon:yes stop_codon:yes gene_type:complete